MQLMVRWVGVWNKSLPGDINADEYDVLGNELLLLVVSTTSVLLPTSSLSPLLLA